MTELKAIRNWHDKGIHNYLVVYKFRKRLAHIAFEDLINSNFKKHFIYCNIENEQSFYLSIPLNRENILIKFKNLISPIKTYFEDSDFLYIVSRIIDSDDEKEIIIGHEIIKEQDKIWTEIVTLHEL